MNPSRRRTVLTIGAAVAVVVLTVGLWAFQPWRVLTSSTIDEALPTVAPGAEGERGSSLSRIPPSASGQSGQVARPAQPAPNRQPVPQVPKVITEGPFVDQEHETSGVAKLVELADGSRLLRLENLATSDGPDVHVWLSDQPSGGSWGSYDDGRYVKLGKLKATNGNQNYTIPADADLTGLRSAVIWCDRFNVAFGTAALSL